MEAEVVSNNHYAADQFSASVALGIDQWADISFWGGEPDILLKVQFSLDGGASFTSLVQGAVDSIMIDPTLGMVHLEGRDLTASLIETRTQETFSNRTASEIASLLAGRHNLAQQVFATTTPVGRYYQDEHDRITLNQFSHSTTEWDLLIFLARQEGFDVFVQGQTLYFQPATEPTEIAALFQPDDLIDLKLERSLTLARDIEVVVKSWNSRQNSAFVQRARANGRCVSGKSASQPQQYVLVRPNLTPDDALKLAQRTLAELTRHERTIGMTVPGELMLTSTEHYHAGGDLFGLRPGILHRRHRTAAPPNRRAHPAYSREEHFSTYRDDHARGFEWSRWDLAHGAASQHC